MTDFSDEGFLNVTPSDKQEDIVYPTPQDPQPPDIPAHFKKNSQAIANNMNHVYDFLHKLSGIDPSDPNDSDGNPIPVVEKVNVAKKDGSTDYGTAKQGLASKGTGENETQWLNFVEQGDFDTEINKPGVKTLPGTIVMWYGELNAIPPGWVLCDGTKDTPDLRGRVPVGVWTGTQSTTRVKISPYKEKGETGVVGESTHKLTSGETYRHKPGGKVTVDGSGTLYANSNNGTTGLASPLTTFSGYHNHFIYRKSLGKEGGNGSVWSAQGSSFTWYTNTSTNHQHYAGAHSHAGDSHNHSINSHGHTASFTGDDAKAATAHNNVQPSVGVYFIMFKGETA